VDLLAHHHGVEAGRHGIARVDHRVALDAQRRRLRRPQRVVRAHRDAVHAAAS
jgi:hypothetical protein